ncbi:hypothetical protein [Lichenibacterium dinghuense]|uniref:hypothetical protein n=1 Tax=Lichenibacterium dinghuense TaxID=2895977 RepID=UPI001F2F96F2|nr:hypothetical protein [Lichenibacterium sp. 6Y81]
MRVAAFDSPGLHALGARLGSSLAVIAAIPDPQAHLACLVREEHACWTLEEDWCFGGVGGQEVDPLAPQFRQIRLDPRWMGDRRLPAGVAIEAGSFLVALPHADSRSRFADELKSRLARRRFEVAGARPGRVLRRRMTGRPLVAAPRYSRPPSAGEGATAFRIVDDLYEFRPKDLPALAAAVVGARDRVTLATDLDALLRRAWS